MFKDLLRTSRETVLLRTIVLTVIALLSASTLFVYALASPWPIKGSMFLVMLSGVLVIYNASDDLMGAVPRWMRLATYVSACCAILVALFISSRTLMHTVGFSVSFAVVFGVPAFGGWRLWFAARNRKHMNSLKSEWYEAGVFMHPAEKMREDPAGFQEWFGTLDADTLHEIGVNWNWDAGPDVLVAILRHPACDRATAMTIYALAEPSYYEKVRGKADGNDEGVQVLNAVTTGFENGLYQDGRFQIDTDFVLSKLKDYRDKRRSADELLFWDLPDRAFERLSGKPAKPKYTLMHGEILMIPFDVWLLNTRKTE